MYNVGCKTGSQLLLPKSRAQQHKEEDCMRKTWKLSEDEGRRLRRLPSEADHGFVFWGEVAKSRGLDPGSLLAEPGHNQFSGLPNNHGCHWCSPQALKCRVKPEDATRNQ
jgi:hypothetical protein